MNFATDELLKAMGIDIPYEKLTDKQRDEFHRLYDKVQARPLTVDDIKQHIHYYKTQVEAELAQDGLSHDRDLILKGRLRNYLLLEALLDSPEQAAKAMQAQIKFKQSINKL